MCVECRRGIGAGGAGINLDLILMDIRLPGMSGLEAVSVIRGDLVLASTTGRRWSQPMP